MRLPDGGDTTLVTPCCASLCHVHALHKQSPEKGCRLQGFPGTVEAAVTYTLTPDSRLLIDFEGTAGAPTPIAMGQHTYFNLDGAAAGGTVLEHQLFVNGCGARTRTAHRAFVVRQAGRRA